jgi:dTDP-4-amino-4,6-dideoxygalactose transaminase
VFADAPNVGGDVAADLFERGVCLPSGSAMTDAEVDEVADAAHRLLA